MDSSSRAFAEYGRHADLEAASSADYPSISQASSLSDLDWTNSLTDELRLNLGAGAHPDAMHSFSSGVNPFSNMGPTSVFEDDLEASPSSRQTDASSFLDRVRSSVQAGLMDHLHRDVSQQPNSYFTSYPGAGYSPRPAEGGRGGAPAAAERADHTARRPAHEPPFPPRHPTTSEEPLEPRSFSPPRSNPLPNSSGGGGGGGGSTGVAPASTSGGGGGGLGMSVSGSLRGPQHQTDFELGLGSADTDGHGPEAEREREGPAGARGASARPPAENTATARVDFQVVGRWLEQFLPFSMLLLLVFLQQHCVGITFFVWMSAVLFRANDVVRKQVALQAEARLRTLACAGLVLAALTAFCYYILRRYALWRQLVLLPPPGIPEFWDAVFDVAMTDTLARYLVIIAKVVLLLVHRQAPGQAFRRQAQLLTLFEYAGLVYRAMLPTPVWYRFFLNEEAYGHLFASATTGLYLTFKLAAVCERGRLLGAAVAAYARQETQYGRASTREEVQQCGDCCSICQEAMRGPITLHCKHVFCESCVSEWLDRERTCPLCRAVVRTAGLRSYGDGSTSLFLQVF